MKSDNSRSSKSTVVTENKHEAQWQRMFELYKEFKAGSGREPKTFDTYKDEKLGYWITRQKRLYNSGKLSPERVKQLEDAGFVFSVFGAQWRQMFELYKEFKEKYGREPQLGDVYEGIDLWSWSNRQKYSYNSGDLSPERAQQLEDAGFVFSVYEAQWERMFELYVEFKAGFGREPKTFDTYKDEKLGLWVAKQRAFNKAGKLLPERKMKLEKNGFLFK